MVIKLVAKSGIGIMDWQVEVQQTTRLYIFVQEIQKLQILEMQKHVSEVHKC